MFVNVERYVEFIAKNNLTQAQFLMMYLIYRKKYDSINRYKIAFPTDDGTMIGTGAKEDLIKRGFIVGEVGEQKAESYQLTDKFLHLFLKDKFEAADQFWNMYPGFVKINETAAPLMNMDKYRFTNIYAERIDHSVEEHLEVMKDLEYGSRNGLIRSTIEKFVMSEGWRKIRSIRCANEIINEVSKLDDDF